MCPSTLHDMPGPGEEARADAQYKAELAVARAAAVNETEVFPDATEMTVADAYDAILELAEIGLRYTIDWHTIPCVECDKCEHILNRFARTVDYEADLIAVPVDEDGKRLRGAKVIVAAIKVPYIRDADDKRAAGQRLREELDAAKARADVYAGAVVA